MAACAAQLPAVMTAHRASEAIPLGRSCPPHPDVAEAGARTHLNRLFARRRLPGALELRVHAPELRVQVEIGGGAVRDPDLQPAAAGLGHDRAARHRAEPHVAVGRLGHDGAVRAIHGDVAVRAVDAQVRGREADPAVAVRILDRSAAIDGTNACRAGASCDIGVAADLIDGDLAEPRAGAQRARALEVDVAAAAREPRVAERARGPHGRHAGTDVELRARGQLDRDLDRPALAEGAPALPAPGRRDEQPAARELDAGLLGGLHVVAPARVARAHLDDGVGALAGGDPHVADADLDGGVNRLRGVED